MFGNFFLKIVSLSDNVEKYCRTRQATNDIIAYALSISDNYSCKHTLGICNI